jgi:hypothetical protein
MINLTHFLMHLFHLSTCFEQQSAHHQEIDLLIHHLVCINTIDLLMMSTLLLETCREVK